MGNLGHQKVERRDQKPTKEQASQTVRRKMSNTPNANAQYTKSTLCLELDEAKTEHVKCSEWKMLKFWML